jgi:hypothetical protein
MLAWPPRSRQCPPTALLERSPGPHSGAAPSAALVAAPILDLSVMPAYLKRATGEKYLIDPSKAS